eukprot:354069-Chlamydomonas_euryale.AAC.27
MQLMPLTVAAFHLISKCVQVKNALPKRNRRASGSLTAYDVATGPGACSASPCKANWPDTCSPHIDLPDGTKAASMCQIFALDHIRSQHYARLWSSMADGS